MELNLVYEDIAIFHKMGNHARPFDGGFAGNRCEFHVHGFKFFENLDIDSVFV